MTSLLPPGKKWWRPLGKDERIWSFLIIVMILMMGVITVGWLVIGKQNPPEKFEKLSYDDYINQATANTQATKVTLSNNVQGLRFSPGSDVYLVAERFQWRVVGSDGTLYQGFQLEKGGSYRLHLYGKDVMHGFEILEQAIMLQVVPEYDYIVDITPQQTGLFLIICNEYCGVGHQNMIGFLEVV